MVQDCVHRLSRLHSVTGTKLTIYWRAKVNWLTVNIFYLFYITSDWQEVKHDRGGGQNFHLVAEARRLRPRSKFWSRISRPRSKSWSWEQSRDQMLWAETKILVLRLFWSQEDLNMSG